MVLSGHCGPDYKQSHYPEASIWHSGVTLRQSANERRVVRALWSITVLLAAQFGAFASPANAAVSDTVFARGSAAYLGSPFFPPDLPTVDMASSPSGNGYYVLNSGGGLTTKGDASFYGHMGGSPLNQPVVAMATHPSGTGYWLMAKDAGIFAFGASAFFGAAPGEGEAVDIVATPTGNGYWIVMADGRVFHRGGAPDLEDAFGSTSSRTVGLARSASGNGYWQLTENGQVFAFGDAPFFGDASGTGKTFTAIAARPDGAGYWLVAKDGTISNHGSAAAFDAVASTFPVVTAAPLPSNTGLWAASSGVAEPGAIQGVVKNTDGQPVGGICVTASNNWDSVGHATTSVTGFYRVGGLKTAAHEVTFTDCTHDTYYRQWFNNADTHQAATPVHVEAGKTTFKVHATMAPGGFISGGVRDEKGDPTFSCVVAFDPATGISHSTSTVTGAYKAGPLKPGTYKVSFTDCGGDQRIGQAWPASDYGSLGHPIAVTAGGHVRNISGVMRSPGQITGVVTNSTGTPLSQICVDARLPGEENRAGHDISTGFTSLTGFYRLTGLRTGAYAVSFRDCGAGNYAPEWFHDAPSEDQADAVHVQAGATTGGVDESLANGAVISGEVQNADGPIANACVSAWQDGQQHFPSATVYSSVTGFYRINGLAQGAYRVRFDPCTPWSESAPAPEWWNNSPTREGAIPLSLAAGEEAGEIIGSLTTPAGAISGVVKDPANTPQPFACVVAQDSSGIKRQVWTSLTGFYRITGLSAQPYKVRFDPCGAAGAPEWFNNKANEVAANPVSVSPGATTPNINARFDQRGSISGVVTRTGGEPIVGACILLTDTAGNEVRSGLPTSLTGFYKLDGLHGGLYKLRFSECDPLPYEKEWWNDADTFAGADTLSVTAGANTTADAELAVSVADSPTNINAVAGNSSAQVSWTPPAYGGTSPTTLFEVTAWTGGFPVRTVTVSSAQTNAVVTGLQNNTQYRFRVAARNAGGLGKQSLLSNAVTPALTASIATPGTVSAPAVVTFSDIVKGVTVNNLVIRPTGTGANLPASVVCKNQGGATVSCATGLVKTATLQPTSALTASQQYTVVVNPAGVAPIRDFAGNIVNRASATFVAGAAAAGVKRV
jgi:Fibronectin type III domain